MCIIQKDHTETFKIEINCMLLLAYRRVRQLVEEGGRACT